jgi:hypothetical protein
MPSSLLFVGTGALEPRSIVSAPITIAAEAMKIPINVPGMAHQSTRTEITRALRLDYAFVNWCADRLTG